MTMSTIRIAVIGDLHTHWDDLDVAYFNRSDYDLLLFTGDLGGGSRDSTLRVARTLSKLAKPTLVMPGNNDVGDIDELAAELAHRGALRQFSAVLQGHSEAGRPGPEPMVRLCGYSAHRIGPPSRSVTLITGRPHSMGGEQLSFGDHMLSAWGIESMAASAARLRALVDQADTQDLLFLAHNGPTGLGDEPIDMWGCDFKSGGGDWGDPDLSEAVEHAIARGHRVLAVIGGHMHLDTKCGRERPWQRAHEGVLYVNPARVPRIYSAHDDVQRHHVAVTVAPDSIEIAEMRVGQYAGQSIVSSSAAMRWSEMP
jgi:uncharacterized protein (TIGR04168 family)